MLAAAACVVSATVVGIAGAETATFVPGPGSPTAVGLHPNSIAAGDLNGDQRTDLVLPSEDTNSVSVLLGSGDGSFTASPLVAVGTSPASVAIADVNRDHRADVLAANSLSNNVSVLLGDGAGGFTAAAPVPAGAGSWYVAAGDLNRDKRPDLAVSNLFANTVSIVLGDGSGGFAPAATVPVGQVPYGIAIADLNRDHNPDLAVANQYAASLSVLLGDGTGAFAPAPGSPIPLGSGPSWVVAAHLDDGQSTDLAVANQGSDTVSILLGNGEGGFAQASGSPVLVGPCFRPGGACGPTGIVAAKLGGDGHLDLATSNHFSDTVSVLVGDGHGGFAPLPGSPFAVGDHPLSLAAGRLDHSGKTDLAAANYGSSDVSILLNTK